MYCKVVLVLDPREAVMDPSQVKGVNVYFFSEVIKPDSGCLVGFFCHSDRRVLLEILRFEQRDAQLRRTKCRGMGGHLLFFESLGSQA